jgi:hypothetical protein
LLTVLQTGHPVLNTGLIALNYLRIFGVRQEMTRSKKVAILLIVLVAATFTIAVTINAQAEQQQNKTVSDKTELSTGTAATTAVAGGAVAQNGTSTVMYLMQQSGKTIQFRSMVQNVDVTGFVITADDQVTVSVAYKDVEKSPSVTVIVSTEWIPMPPYMGATTSPGVAEPSAGVVGGLEPNVNPGYYPYPRSYPSLVGSNVVKGDWGSAAEVKLGLVGNGSIYDATSIQVLIIPYTGSP